MAIKKGKKAGKGGAKQALKKAAGKITAAPHEIGKLLRKREVSAFVASKKREMPPRLKRHFVSWGKSYLDSLVSKDKFDLSRRHLFRLTRELGGKEDPLGIMPVSIVREAIGYYLQQECGIPYSREGESLHTKAKGKMRAEFIAFAGRDINTPEKKIMGFARAFDDAVMKLSARYLEWENRTGR